MTLIASDATDHPGARLMLLNAFDMACAGHIQQGMWRHPRDRSADYAQLSHWTDLARLLERGLFDGLFLADVLGIYDVHGGSPDAALRGGVQVPLLDPLMLVPAMAAVTEHLGFGVTCNLAYEPPYLFARRMSTLDHLTQGRIGWNIVTGYLDSAARALGYTSQMAHDDRYDLADEYMDAVYALWEGSWDDGAVLRDRAGGIFTDPAKVRRIEHSGRQYQISATHLCEPSPQRTPVLYQAGASERGRTFAGQHAECVFVNGTNPAIVGKLVADLRARAAPRPIRAMVGATVVVGRTEREARDMLADYATYADAESVLAHASASLGIDFARYGMDEPIEAGKTNAIQSNVAAMTKVAGPAWTKRKLLEQSVLGSRQPPIVGDAVQVADALQAWMAAADVDGFNLSRTVMPECLETFIDLVIPVLQERGAYKTAYAPGTYREKLFGQGDLLPAAHRAAHHRQG
jgi:FMN-dependent oxidoreductase (nitrilotriacetate monooxygenase family)